MPYTLTQHWPDNARTVDEYAAESQAQDAADDASWAYSHAPSDQAPTRFILRAPDGAIIRQWPHQ